MKTLKHILLLLLILSMSVARAEQPKFMMVVSQETDMKDPLNVASIQMLTDGLRKEFKKHLPCADLQDISDIYVSLKFRRQQALLGTPGAEDIRDIAGAMGIEYLIIMHVTNMNNNVRVSANCCYFKKLQIIAGSMFTAPGAAFNECSRQAATALVKELTELEICPYVGPVKLNISSELDSTETEDYGVYCNNSDQRYHKKTYRYRKGNQEWELEKKSKAWTEGTMTFSFTESGTVDEENGCYKCRAGKEGARFYNEKYHNEASGSGISHESTRYGKKQEDTRIEISFFKDSTYIVNVLGTSGEGTKTEKIEAKATGVCADGVNQKTTLTQKITIPLHVILGPFKGTTMDLHLKENGKMETTDPLTGEKLIITYDFDLIHK